MSLAIQVFFLSVLFASVILNRCVAILGKKCSLWVKAGILNGSGQMDTFVMRNEKNKSAGKTKATSVRNSELCSQLWRANLGQGPQSHPTAHSLPLLNGTVENRG